MLQCKAGQYNTIQYNNTSHIITHNSQSNTQEILYEQSKINISAGFQLLCVTVRVYGRTEFTLSVVL